MIGPLTQLFTVEEALSRLGQVRAHGCLVVSKGTESVHLYVRDGFVVNAQGRDAEGEEAVVQALRLSGATYDWSSDALPSEKDTKNVHRIRDLLAKHGNQVKPNFSVTNRIELGMLRREPESNYRYFLVPKADPTVKHYLIRNATVLGREDTSDLVLDDKDISRRHCLLDIQPRGLFVMDLESTNGTYVNGILVRDGYINPGDHIELGSYLLTVNREPIGQE